MERSLVQALIEFPTRNPSIPAMIGRLGVRTVSIPVERKMRPVGRSTYTEPLGQEPVAPGPQPTWCQHSMFV
jgi:hypothetical protein